MIFSKHGLKEAQNCNRVWTQIRCWFWSNRWNQAKKSWITSRKVISKVYKFATYGYSICKRMQCVCILNDREYQLDCICSCRANIRWFLHLLQVGRIRENAWNLGFIRFQVNLTHPNFFCLAPGWKFSRYENLTLVFFSLKNNALFFDI